MLNWIGGTALHHAPQAARTDGNLFEPSGNHAIDGGFRRKAQPANALWLGLAALAAAATAFWWTRARHRVPSPFS